MAQSIGPSTGRQPLKNLKGFGPLKYDIFYRKHDNFQHVTGTVIFHLNIGYTLLV